MNSSKHSREEVRETIKVYERLFYELAGNPRRISEEDTLMDRIINKIGELFRYEELLLSMGSTALRTQDEHRRLAVELSLDIMGGIDMPIFATLTNKLYETANLSNLPVSAELKNLIQLQDIDNKRGFRSIDLEDDARELIVDYLYKLYPGLKNLVQDETVKFSMSW